MKCLVSFLAIAVITCGLSTASAQQCNVGRNVTAVTQVDNSAVLRQLDLDNARLSALRQQNAQQQQVASRQQTAPASNLTLSRPNPAPTSFASQRTEATPVCNGCQQRSLVIQAPAPAGVVAPMIVQQPQAVVTPGQTLTIPGQTRVVPGQTYQVPGPPVTVQGPPQVIQEPATTIQTPPSVSYAAPAIQGFAAPAFAYSAAVPAYGFYGASVGVGGFGFNTVGFGTNVALAGGQRLGPFQAWHLGRFAAISARRGGAVNIAF